MAEPVYAAVFKTVGCGGIAGSSPARGNNYGTCEVSWMAKIEMFRAAEVTGRILCCRAGIEPTTFRSLI